MSLRPTARAVVEGVGLAEIGPDRASWNRTYHALAARVEASPSRRLWGAAWYRVNLDLVSRNERERVALRDHGHDELRLHHGERIADAETRSRTERDIRHIRALWRVRGKSIGIESLGIVPVVRRRGEWPTGLMPTVEPAGMR